MSDEPTVTFWLDRLQAGDRNAAQPLWERYFDRLVGLARRRLRGVRRTAVDEEDVALSAFDSFCRAAEQGRFPQLNDRDDLWRLLVAIAERKAIDLGRRQHALKHGGGRIVGESGLVGGDEGAGGLASLPDPEPTPDFAALVAEECERLLRRLGDDRLRAVALLKMEGYRNDEIAGRLDCALRTIERKLALIRAAWEEEGRS